MNELDFGRCRPLDGSQAFFNPASARSNYCPIFAGIVAGRFGDRAWEWMVKLLRFV